jgi:hypothetical protein
MSPAAWLLKGLVQLYRYTVSPYLGPVCRYMPSCSEYALDALSSHGAVRGGWLAARRVLRCHPWGGSGWDPVPAPGDGKRHDAHHRSCGCAGTPAP